MTQGGHIGLLVVFGVCTKNIAGRMTSHKNGHVVSPCLVYDMIMACLFKALRRMLNILKDVEFKGKRRPEGLAFINLILHD